MTGIEVAEWNFPRQSNRNFSDLYGEKYSISTNITSGVLTFVHNSKTKPKESLKITTLKHPSDCFGFCKSKNKTYTFTIQA